MRDLVLKPTLLVSSCGGIAAFQGGGPIGTLGRIPHCSSHHGAAARCQEPSDSDELLEHGLHTAYSGQPTRLGIMISLDPGMRRGKLGLHEGHSELIAFGPAAYRVFYLQRRLDLVALHAAVARHRNGIKRRQSSLSLSHTHTALPPCTSSSRKPVEASRELISVLFSKHQIPAELHSDPSSYPVFVPP